MDETGEEVDAGGREDTYIALPDCKVGYLYNIDGRNASLGVYADDGEFMVRRYKFGDVFIDSEDHWDKDNGTVKPIKCLCRVPEIMYADGNRSTKCFHESRLIKWLEEQGMKLPEEHDNG